jgi:hypothetical protein
MGEWSITPLILNVGTRWRRVTNSNINFKFPAQTRFYPALTFRHGAALYKLKIQPKYSSPVLRSIIQQSISYNLNLYASPNALHCLQPSFQKDERTLLGNLQRCKSAVCVHVKICILSHYSLPLSSYPLSLFRLQRVTLYRPW